MVDIASINGNFCSQVWEYFFSSEGILSPNEVTARAQ